MEDPTTALDLSSRKSSTSERINVKLEPEDSDDADSVPLQNFIKVENDEGPKKIWIKEEIKEVESSSESGVPYSIKKEVEYSSDDSSTGNKNADVQFSKDNPSIFEPIVTCDEPTEILGIPPLLTIRKTRKKNSHKKNEESSPKKKSKNTKPKKKQENKSMCDKSNITDSLIYSEEVIRKIEVVNIDEEERQIEHKELLHSRSHMKYLCTECAMGYVAREAYLSHMRVHSAEAGDYECDICHSRLRSGDVLYRHRLRHYRRYRCVECHARHRDKDSAACHVMSDHMGQMFACRFCTKAFKRPQYLRRHVAQNHTKPLRLVCPHEDCARVFHERGWYRSHIRSHSEEIRSHTVKVQVTCAVCYRDFNNKMLLRRHLATHEKDTAVCNICQFRCKDRPALLKHSMNEHDGVWTLKPPEERCPLCMRVLFTAAMLRRHMKRMHAVQSDYKPTEQSCPQCSRVLSTPAMLRRHVKRMHSDRTKNFECGECGGRYLTKREVRAHVMWSHLPVSAGGGHACSCGRVFRTPALRARHALRAHRATPRATPHVCRTCGKCFADKHVMIRHEKVHSDKTYPCQECGMSFKTESYVQVHYKLKHLNMTRAQIIAEKKRKPPLMIDKNLDPDKISPQLAEIIKKSIKENKKAMKGNRRKSRVTKDPLFVSCDDIKKEPDVSVPMFETFVDVQRE